MMHEWLKFDFNEYESEEEYLLAQEKLIARQEEKDITMKEWNTVWLMYGATQRQGTTDYHLQELRRVVKTRGTNMQKDFINKYRELKVESHRGAQAACADTLYMGTPSKSRQRFEEQRIRRDSKGRDYYQDRKSRRDDRGRTFFRKYYRPQKERRRDFSRDMRSYSGQRSKSRDSGEYRKDRGRSKDRKNSEKRSKSGCRGCKCESCEKILNLANELKVNWCQNIIIDEEIVVNFTENRKHVMILDLGAPVSVAGNEWMNKYLKDHNLGLENLEVYKCHQIFKFGPSRQYISEEMVNLPIILKTLDGREFKNVKMDELVSKSIKEIQDIRKANGTEPLTKAELKEYRKHTGKLSWLAQGTRPDLSYSVIDLSKKNNSATIADLRNINRIVEKVKKEENKVIYKKLGNRKDLQIIGIVDASYKVDKNL